MTAVSTAEVAMSPETLRPARDASTKIATSEAAAVRTSERMRDVRTPIRGKSSENSSS